MTFSWHLESMKSDRICSYDRNFLKGTFFRFAMLPIEMAEIMQWGALFDALISKPTYKVFACSHAPCLTADHQHFKIDCHYYK